MKAKCPRCFGMRPACIRCGGEGFIDVKFPKGELYSKDCLACQAHIGGCVVGEGGLKEVPGPTTCVFCKNGTAVYTLVGRTT